MASAARTKEDKPRGRQRRGSSTPRSTSGSNSQAMQSSEASQPARDTGRGTGRQSSQSSVASSRGSDRTTSQSTRGRSTAVASSSTGDSVTQSSQSSVADSTKDLDRKLRKRLEYLQLGKNRTSQNASAVNLIQDVILQYLKNDDRSLKWKVCKSGSYYERTKIDKPDEYDCMMVCEMRCKPDYSCSPGDAAFCAFKTVAINASGGPNYPLSNPQLLTAEMDNGAIYISPKAFKKHFRDKILDAIEQESSRQLKDLQIVVQLNEPGCPAVTLTVRGQRGSAVQQHSIDIVPAIQLLEWPKPAKTWKLRRNPDLENKIKNPDESGKYPFAVAKIHHTEKSCPDNETIFWRISFSAAEKQLTLHADQGPSSDSGSTCRKSVLRLLKSDLYEFKANNENNDALCSFHIKTTFLHLMDKVPDDSQWTKDLLLARYIDGLRMLIDSLQKDEIRHYFIRSANLLNGQQTDKRRHQRYMKAVEQYFSHQLVKYTV